MNVTTIVYGIIGITVGIIVITSVLLGTIDKASETYADYAPLFGLVGILSVIAIVMIAVRMMGSSKN